MTLEPRELRLVALCMSGSTAAKLCELADDVEAGRVSLAPVHKPRLRITCEPPSWLKHGV